MGKRFNDYRFAGLNHFNATNKYMGMQRVSDDETRIVVKVADAHIFKSRYGYGLILDSSHVVWLKDWAVDDNYYGIEVMLDKQYFNVKEWGSFADFDTADEDELCWDHWLGIAKAQRDAGNQVRWTR